MCWVVWTRRAELLLMQSFRVINFDSTVHCYNVLRVHKLKPQSFWMEEAQKQGKICRFIALCADTFLPNFSLCDIPARLWRKSVTNFYSLFFSDCDVLLAEIGGVNKHGKLGVSSAKCYICKCKLRTLRVRRMENELVVSHHHSGLNQL